MSMTDRLVSLFALEISWLLCVLQLADTPLLATAGATTVAVVLCLGGACLAVGLLLAALRTPPPVHVTTIGRGVGIVLMVGGLLAAGTSPTPTNGLALACLGVILAATGMTRRRTASESGARDRAPSSR